MEYHLQGARGMEESISSGLPSGWEQGAPVAGWGAANIPAGYGAAQPPPGYPLIQQHAHSPYGVADLTSRYGTAGSPVAYGPGSPVAYGTTDPAAAYRAIPGPIGYEAANLHSRYGLIDSPQDYRRTIPHSVYDEKGHNSGYSTPDHAVGYAQSEYEKSEPSSGYGRSDSALHYETTGSHSPYDRSEPSSDFARTDPSRGYDRRETHSEYEKTEHQSGYERVEPSRYGALATVKTEPQSGYENVDPSGYGSLDPLSGRATAESHAGYEKSTPTTEYDSTEPATAYTARSHLGYENTEHTPEFEKPEHETVYKKSKQPSEYDTTEQHSVYDTLERHSEYGTTEHHSEHDTTEHTEHHTTEHPSEHHTREHPSEHGTREHPSEHSATEHPSEHSATEHPSEHAATDHPSEHAATDHPSEHAATEHTSEHAATDHPSEYDTTEHPSQYDTTDHSSENDKTEHYPQFKKTESSDYEKTEDSEHHSENELTDSTKEKEMKESALAVSNSEFETNDSSSAWEKSNLPPGWERRIIQGENGKAVEKYYISPTGKTLRSKHEVIMYCQEEGFEVDLKLFKFPSDTGSHDKGSPDKGSPACTSEHDTTEQPPENKAEDSSEIEKTDSSEHKKPQETEHHSEQDATDSTAENNTEEPASGYEGGSHSIFETGNSSNWANAELPPGWERKVVERQNSTATGKRVDIYYISPTGKKLRSRPEVVRYCEEHGLDFDLQSFGFTLKKIGSPAMPSSPASPKDSRGRGRTRGLGRPRGSTSKTKKGGRTEREVEKILDHREAGGGDTMYYVKWFGYHESYNTWELTASLGPDAADHIEHYWARKEAQSQINQNILQSIMQIHSNGAGEEPDGNIENEEHTEEIPSYFPEHFLSPSFEESEPVKPKGKAKRGRPRGRVSSFPQHFLSSFTEELEPIKMQKKNGRGRSRGRGRGSNKDTGYGRGRPRGRPRKDNFSSFDDTSSDSMHVDPDNFDAGLPAALQCETVMQEGNQENPSPEKETEHDSGLPAALQCETVMQDENQESSSGSQENKEPAPDSEKKDDTPPETVLVPELADKPRCPVLDKASGKMYEREIDAIIAHQTKGVKEIKYFVRYFTTLDKLKGKGHAWIFASELKDTKEMLEVYWDKRNSSGKERSSSSTATQSQRQVNNAPAVTKPPEKKVLAVIDLSDDEAEGKKNMAKPSQPLGQQLKQHASSISSWHTPVIDEPPNASKQEEYQVERIMLHRKRNGKTQYLVKWKDYPQSEATWEPEENLKNCKSVLDAYHKRKIEKVVFHRDLGGKREYLIKWEGFFSRHNSWETPETCSHLRDFQTHVNEYWRRKQEEADRKKRNLEECQQYYNTVKERENRQKRPRMDSAPNANKQWVIDSLCKTRDDDMEPGFLIKLCLLNTAINSLRCDRCAEQSLQFVKAGESLLSELSIKCTKCPDIKSFSTSEPSKNEPFLDIGGGEYIPLATEAQPVVVPIPVPVKKVNEEKTTSSDTTTENTSSGNTKTTDSEVNSVEKTEINEDLKSVEKTEIKVDEIEKMEIKIKQEKDDTRISDTLVADNKEATSSSSRMTTTEVAASRSTSTIALPESITQSNTPNIENSNAQRDKEQLSRGCETNLEKSSQESISLTHDNLNKETRETEPPANGASKSTTNDQSMDDDDDDIIMTEPEDPLCL